MKLLGRHSKASGSWRQKERSRNTDRYRASDNPSVYANLKACMRMLSEKLKDHHLLLGTSRTAEALDEQKRVCMALGLLSKEKQHFITSVSERLLVITEAPPATS